MGDERDSRFNCEASPLRRPRASVRLRLHEPFSAALSAVRSIWGTSCCRPTRRQHLRGRPLPGTTKSFRSDALPIVAVCSSQDIGFGRSGFRLAFGGQSSVSHSDSRCWARRTCRYLPHAAIRHLPARRSVRPSCDPGTGLPYFDHVHRHRWYGRRPRFRQRFHWRRGRRERRLWAGASHRRADRRSPSATVGQVGTVSRGNGSSSPPTARPHTTNNVFPTAARAAIAACASAAFSSAKVWPITGRW